MHVSRRRFLRQVAVIAAATGLPSWFIERQMAYGATPKRKLSPNDRPGIALIGCGGMGKGDVTNAANHGDIVAVCDVEDRHAAAQLAASPEGDFAAHPQGPHLGLHGREVHRSHAREANRYLKRRMRKPSDFGFL